MSHKDIPPIVKEILLTIEAYVAKRRCTFADLFRAVDKGGDGDIDLEELRTGLDRIGIRVNNANFALLSETFDPDGSGEIDFEEFEDALKMVTAQDNNTNYEEEKAEQLKQEQEKLKLEAKKKEALRLKKDRELAELKRKKALNSKNIINEPPTLEGAHARILQLNTLLKQTDRKWKKKLSQLKGVLHDHHHSNLKTALAKQKQTHKEEIRKFTGVQVDEDSRNQGNREKDALRAKCVRLTKEVNVYKKILEDQQQEKETRASQEGATKQAKARWSMVRSDMNKTIAAKDKFAEIMRLGTMKALRSVREDALQALAETRRKLEQASDEAEKKEEDLSSASVLQQQMNEQIDFLSSLVERTDQEKKRYEEKSAKATSDKVKQRFAAAKLATNQRRNEKALIEANKKIYQLQGQVEALREQIIDDEDLSMTIALLTDKLESNVTVSNCLRGWIRFQGISNAILIKTLRDDLTSTTVEINHQQEQFKEQEKEMHVLKTAFQDAQKRLKTSVKIVDQIKIEFEVVRMDRCAAQKMILSLASHTNTLMQSLSASVGRYSYDNGGPHKHPSKNSKSSSSPSSPSSLSSPSSPSSPSTSTTVLANRTQMLLSNASATVAHHQPTPPTDSKGSTATRKKHRSLRQPQMEPILCFLDVPVDSAILMGWALSNNYKTLLARTNNRNDSMTRNTFQKIYAIIWYPATPDKNEQQLPALTHVVPETNIEGEKFTKQRCFQNMLEWMKQQDEEGNKTDANEEATLTQQDPLVVIISDEDEWHDYVLRDDNDNGRVHCIRPPLTSKKLSSSLALRY